MFRPCNMHVITNNESLLQISVYVFKIRQFTIKYARSLGRWDKQIVDKESDVPCIIFFNTFHRHSKLFIFIFVIF